jgi:hypothetical protein
VRKCAHFFEPTIYKLLAVRWAFALARKATIGT